MAKLGPTDSASNPTPKGVYEEAAKIVNFPLPIDTTNGQQQSAPVTSGLTYGVLRQTSPCYDAGYWRRLRAFYKGGKHLLRDKELMAEVFPRHRDEIDEVYKERCKRAFYMPYAGEIVDHILAALTAEPLVATLEGAEEGEPLPDFYDGFVKDCSPPGGEEVSINQLVRKAMLEAMQVQCAWVFYDAERVVGPDGQPLKFYSRADEIKAGASKIYADLLLAETVIDWEEGPNRELEWAVIHTMECKRGGLAGRRDTVTERWVYWTPVDWEKFEIKYPKSKPPRDEDPVTRVDGAFHTHGKVPLRRLILPDGLWVMEKLEGLAREHFNKRSGLSWAEFQSLFSELYEFLGPEVSSKGAIIGENQEDPGRALAQTRGQGYVQVRGKDDEAKFVGPDSSSFAQALASCTDVRDEMHRVTHQMKLSVDNSAAALTRSGESKAHDKAAETVVLTYLGLLCREFLKGLMKDVSTARKELELVERWDVKGMEKFDDVATSDVVDQAVLLEGVSIPSPTFQRRFKSNLARAVLGSEASPEDLEQIEAELEKNVTDDQYDPTAIAEKEQADLEAQMALKAGTELGGKPKGKPPQ